MSWRDKYWTSDWSASAWSDVDWGKSDWKGRKKGDWGSGDWYSKGSSGWSGKGSGEWGGKGSGHWGGKGSKDWGGKESFEWSGNSGKRRPRSALTAKGGQEDESEPDTWAPHEDMDAWSASDKGCDKGESAEREKRNREEDRDDGEDGNVRSRKKEPRVVKSRFGWKGGKQGRSRSRSIIRAKLAQYQSGDTEQEPYARAVAPYGREIPVAAPSSALQAPLVIENPFDALETAKKEKAEQSPVEPEPDKKTKISDIVANFAFNLQCNAQTYEKQLEDKVKSDAEAARLAEIQRAEKEKRREEERKVEEERRIREAEERVIREVEEAKLQLRLEEERRNREEEERRRADERSAIEQMQARNRQLLLQQQRLLEEQLRAKGKKGLDMNWVDEHHGGWSSDNDWQDAPQLNGKGWYGSGKQPRKGDHWGEHDLGDGGIQPPEQHQHMRDHRYVEEAEMPYDAPEEPAPPVRLANIPNPYGLYGNN
eukprot:GEMP01035875.1.p1 GENE.GEMP01035875.1~~GEMP01035875.1.p1  ORF type:complete len:482 (+),score=161.63 GEMP01035875.1:452-1897(+)